MNKLSNTETGFKESIAYIYFKNVYFLVHTIFLTLACPWEQYYCWPK